MGPERSVRHPPTVQPTGSRRAIPQSGRTRRLPIEIGDCLTFAVALRVARGSEGDRVHRTEYSVRSTQYTGVSRVVGRLSSRGTSDLDVRPGTGALRR